MAPYTGCYNDNEKTRDLDLFIGSNMPLRDCFDRVKEKSYRYAGL